jgi:hypothetical protein
MASTSSLPMMKLSSCAFDGAEASTACTFCGGAPAEEAASFAGAF